MTILKLLSRLIPKEVLGYRPLDIQIRYVLERSEPSQIMLLLENIGYVSPPTWTSRVHVTITQLKLGDIFYMSVEDLTGTGTREEIR